MCTVQVSFEKVEKHKWTKVEGSEKTWHDHEKQLLNEVDAINDEDGEMIGIKKCAYDIIDQVALSFGDNLVNKIGQIGGSSLVAMVKQVMLPRAREGSKLQLDLEEFKPYQATYLIKMAQIKCIQDQNIKKHVIQKTNESKQQAKECYESSDDED